ncbi:MAG: ParB N-terminal domain-containing protein [Cyanobacteria bacterium P01_D01_bin.56]
MAKRSKTVDFLENISTVTEQMQVRDQEVSNRRAEERGDFNAVSLERIRPRDTDTRPLNENHVESLAESIAILGLIEPLVVDQDKVLLAGGHRLAAIKFLQENDAAVFGQQFPNKHIPVRIMPFRANDDAERALQIEVAENEHRRDYTPAEVRNIADHLRKAGYREGRGRPKQGEKPLMPALSVVIGKNRRTIQRYLHEPTVENRTDVQIYLKKARRSLKNWQKEAPRNSQNTALIAKLPEFLELLDQLLAENNKR